MVVTLSYPFGASTPDDQGIRVQLWFTERRRAPLYIRPNEVTVINMDLGAKQRLQDFLWNTALTVLMFHNVGIIPTRRPGKAQRTCR
jgi:hypothetical protein